jgi:hypothetical protein
VHSNKTSENDFRVRTINMKNSITTIKQLNKINIITWNNFYVCYYCCYSSPIILQDPTCVARSVLPYLNAYVTDHLEGCKITYTYDSRKSKRPCSACLCSRDDLVNRDADINYKTQEVMMGHLERYENYLRSGFKAAANLVLQEHFFHPVAPCLWDFRGNETIDGSGYRCIMVEHMHEADLGIQQHLILCLRKALGKTVCKRLDK